METKNINIVHARPGARTKNTPARHSCDVVLAAEELDWDGATEALGQEEVIESFRDFMNAVLTRGYRFKAQDLRNHNMMREVEGTHLKHGFVWVILQVRPRFFPWTCFSPQGSLHGVMFTGYHLATLACTFLRGSKPHWTLEARLQPKLAETALNIHSFLRVQQIHYFPHSEKSGRFCVGFAQARLISKREGRSGLVLHCPSSF